MLANTDIKDIFAISENFYGKISKHGSSARKGHYLDKVDHSIKWFLSHIIM